MSLGLHSGLGAQQAPPAPAKRQPIVCKWTTLDGMNYYLAGDKVTDTKKLQPIISDLHDPEADRLIKLSAQSKDSGILFLAGGTVLLIGGGGLIVTDPNSGSLDEKQTFGLALVLAGLAGDYLGAFKLEESLTSKFAAVQRYNAVVHGDDLTSFNRPPKPAFQAQLLTFRF